MLKGIHNKQFEKTEYWEDKASNTEKLRDSKLASPPDSLNFTVAAGGGF